MQGEVVAINTAVAGNAENIGFAIPINDAQGLIKSVLKSGKLERPYLGVRYVTLTDDYAYQYNLDIKRGAYLAPSQGQSAVITGSPADKAGLKEKDIITKVNNESIDEKNSLISLLGRSGVGDKITLTIVRDGKEMTVDVALEAAP
jgi:serine protease Do